MQTKCLRSAGIGFRFILLEVVKYYSVLILVVPSTDDTTTFVITTSTSNNKYGLAARRACSCLELKPA